ncbi:uncharacterized protein HMPREF1541_06625 [Cyphellophora europaea CBS 101466]|uniref:F-box domain-containing protein n=1 Tax=Cyphellophora europaea (strain CBS 101466) TaxID=1220924 RepID=W2RS75_CYPE1|nr:uncharacterized protein HMPREF1541_06625 [Cyphellophora europaea CBS 101466]ETN38588.1 hypothetical protein HMPREF1541_06625 [Cyphellophora europaea CBS 101466]
MAATTQLPAEICSEIFAYALAPVKDSDIRTIPCLNLLAACKQIHNETCLLPFQSNTISLPAITDSSTSASLSLLQRLSARQLRAVRGLNLQVVGSVLDATAAAKVLRLLRLGNDQWDLTLDSAARFLPRYEGDLRELSITVSSRDIAVPLADGRTGLQKTLDPASSPLMSWLPAFQTLRKLQLRVRVMSDQQFPKELRDQLQLTLEARMPETQVQTQFEALSGPDAFVDDFDMYPDSYIGLWGNVCPYRWSITI